MFNLSTKKATFALQNQKKWQKKLTKPKIKLSL